MKSDEVYRAHILDAIAAIERYSEWIGGVRLLQEVLL